MHKDTAYLLILKKNEKPIVVYSRYLLIGIKVLLILVLLIMQPPFFLVLTPLLLLMTIMEIRAIRLVPAVGFSSNVVFTGVFKKKYTWQEIDNLILKDGLLTINFTNNRLWQKEIENKVDEAEFNEWCRKKYTA